MVEVHVHIEKKLLLSNKAPKFKEELLNLMGNDSRLIMESVTPRRTSRGANSYKIIKGNNSREIRNDVHYLTWVNEGTGIYGPHHQRIRPVHARVLHFHWKGREWFVKSVRGQEPKHFVERGVRDITKIIPKNAVIAKNKTF